MADGGARPGEHRDVLVIDVHAVHGDEPLVEKAEPGEPLEGAHAVLLEALAHLARGLGDMDVHGRAVFLRERDAAPKRRVAHRVGRVRAHGRPDEGVAAELLEKRLGLREVFVVVRAPGGGKADHEPCDGAAQPRLAQAARGGAGEEVLVGRGRHAAGGHL